MLSCSQELLTTASFKSKIKHIALAMNFPEDEPISSPLISKQIERAQKQVEGRNFSIRKRVLSYDDVMNAQREIIYKERGKVLDGLDIHDQILDMIDDLAEEVIGDHADYKYDYQTWLCRPDLQPLRRRPRPDRHQ